MAPKTLQCRLTHTGRARIHTLYYTARWTQPRISKELGVPQRTVNYCLKQPITPVKQQGCRPLLTTPIRQHIQSIEFCI